MWLRLRPHLPHESIGLPDAYHPMRSTNVKKTVFYMRAPGIEPGSPAWKAGILPLDHTRVE